jgi:cyclic lactone autoinducer peptide
LLLYITFAFSTMLLIVSFFVKLVVDMSSCTACCSSISQPDIKHLLSNKKATLMGSPFNTFANYEKLKAGCEA